MGKVLPVPHMQSHFRCTTRRTDREIGASFASFTSTGFPVCELLPSETSIFILAWHEKQILANLNTIETTVG